MEDPAARMGDDDSMQSGAWNQLIWSIRALAVDARSQRALFPDFVSKTEELALDFDNWFMFERPRLVDGLSPASLDALRAINDQLNEMSFRGARFDEELWHDEALETRPEWEELRTMAGHALRCLGRPLEPPPYGRSFYASGTWLDTGEGAELIDYRDVLRKEFDCEDGSFLLRLRSEATWDGSAFARMIAAMERCAADHEGKAEIERWIARGFWFVEVTVPDLTRGPGFAGSYREAALVRLNELSYWLFFGESPYEAGGLPPFGV